MKAKPNAVERRRRNDPEKRRQAILEAGLSIFASQGFAAAKLDDVAASARVAKGTIYLYFRDKEDLFEQIVRNAVEPVIEKLQQNLDLPDVSTDELLDMLFNSFRTAVFETDRKKIIRLVIAEGPRFPEIAAFYHREVVCRLLGLLKQVARRGVARGELASPDLETFPHLIVAPLALSIMWDGLFSDLDPLDMQSLLNAHRRLLTASNEAAV